MIPVSNGFPLVIYHDESDKCGLQNTNLPTN